MKVGIACDHAGFELKEEIKEHFKNKYEFEDFGTFSNVSVDYPDFAHKLGTAIQNNVLKLGISICGSGNGINMTVNKYPQVRAALCWSNEISALARLHNNANICSLPARFVTKEQAIEILETFFTTEFEEGRHLNRINKIPIK